MQSALEEGSLGLGCNASIRNGNRYQNRNGTRHIDSDDEESEFGPVSNRFAKKAANSRWTTFFFPKEISLEYQLGNLIQS